MSPFQLQASHLSLEDPTSAPGATRQYILVSRLEFSYLTVCSDLTTGCYGDCLHGGVCVCVYAAEKVSVELFVLCPVDKSVSEVHDNPVNLWEEGRIEDELSPEEIQMVCMNLFLFL